MKIECLPNPKIQIVFENYEEAKNFSQILEWMINRYWIGEDRVEYMKSVIVELNKVL